jgi:hypothetical protein
MPWSLLLSLSYYTRSFLKKFVTGKVKSEITASVMKEKLQTLEVKVGTTFYLQSWTLNVLYFMLFSGTQWGDADLLVKAHDFVQIFHHFRIMNS